jgi:hypothetical protein
MRQQQIYVKRFIASDTVECGCPMPSIDAWSLRIQVRSRGLSWHMVLPLFEFAEQCLANSEATKCLVFACYRG